MSGDTKQLGTRNNVGRGITLLLCPRRTMRCVFKNTTYAYAYAFAPPVRGQAAIESRSDGRQDVWRIAWAAAVFENLTVEDVALLAGKHADVPPSSYPPLALQAIAEVSIWPL